MAEHGPGDGEPRGTLGTLERQLHEALDGTREEIRYRFENGRVRFAEHVRRRHRQLRMHALRYLVQSRPLTLLTAPLIYLLIVPFALLDLMVGVYQLVCFPVYGIPRVRRSEYLVLDRQHLAYLNVIEKLNCLYCAYANGLLAYVVEIAARTEQHWCPIRHARRIPAPHSRYPHFLEYGDAEGYRAHVEEVRCDFGDLAPGRRPPGE